jgi:glycine/D-amino acid oxidase-like deaminating enzyme
MLPESWRRLTSAATNIVVFVDTYRCDILIVGGGIAGLWTANRLQQDGWNVALLESAALGAGQTLASQGIMHSGVKYGIDGSNREIAQQLKTLPPRWMASLAGQGEVDLGGVKVLSPQQYLWSRDRLVGGFTSSMAGKAMQGEVEDVPKERWPEVLQANPPSGSLYAVKEAILDIQTVVRDLARPLQGRAIIGQIQKFHPSGEGLTALEVAVRGGRVVRLEAGAFVFTAGEGNEQAAVALGFGVEVTQRRPLRMVMARGLVHPVYGHCVTTSPKPRATITAHPHEGQWVWYLGGEVAEIAPGMTEAETLRRAKAEMKSIFPSLNWEAVEWACHEVNRAEPRDPKGHLPHEPRLLTRGNSIIAWPTKLVYAPLLADRVRERLPGLGLKPSVMGAWAGFPVAETGQLPWQQAVKWSRI